MKNLLDFKATI